MESRTDLERAVARRPAESLKTRLPQLTSRLGALARRWLRHRLVNGADADDLVQEVLLSAIQAEGSYRGQTEAELEGWLAAILRHRAINLLQREERFQQLREQLLLTRPEPRRDSEPAEELGELVASMIQRLDRADQEIILLRFLGEMDWNALADRLATTPEAARKRASRALVRLQSLLGTDGGQSNNP